MSKFFELLRKTIMVACKIFLIAQVIIVSYVVFGRYILNKTPGWGEEGALLFMVWFCLISAALAIKTDTHLRVTAIDAILPPKAIRFLDFFNLFIMGCFAIFMIIEGYNITVLSHLNIMPGLRIQSSFLFASVPVAGVSMLIVLIEKAGDLICQKK